MRIGYLESTLLAVAAVGVFSLIVRRKGQERSSWPTWLLVPVVVFFAIPMGVAMPDPLRPFRFLVFAIVLSRWVVALVRRERSRGWIFYVVLLVLAQLFIHPLAEMFTQTKRGQSILQSGNTRTGGAMTSFTVRKTVLVMPSHAALVRRRR